ncbi:MAG TPA: hypothetical protein VMW72_01370 [Sedimentisphaerales bacterium]|nr:hypothetical protein [Sedimentisphaerales bacterium]
MKEEEYLAKYRERLRTKPLKFKSTKTEDGTLTITQKKVTGYIALTKMTKASGTVDFELQTCLLTPAMETCFDFVGRSNGHD